MELGRLVARMHGAGPAPRDFQHPRDTLRADRHADVWALIDPVGLELLPEEPEKAAAIAERWLTVYADAARLDRDRVRCDERPDPDSAGWVAALRRMADALGRAGPRG